MESKNPPLFTQEVKDAADRLLEVMPHLEIAANMARIEMPDGVLGLAITVKNGKNGRITATFELDEFLKDLKAVVDFMSYWELPRQVLELDQGPGS